MTTLVFLRDAVLLSEKCRRCQTQAGNFKLFTCVSEFWLVPTSNKHFLSPIRVDTIIDGVRRSSICRRFWESSKRFVEINSTLPLTKLNQKSVMKELDGFSLFKFIFAGYLWLLYICSLSLVLPEIILPCCYITSWAKLIIVLGVGGRWRKKDRDHLSPLDWREGFTVRRMSVLPIRLCTLFGTGQVFHYLWTSREQVT